MIVHVRFIDSSAAIEIGHLRHAYAIGARREPTARTCHRRHFRRRGDLHQCRGAAGAPSTRSWRLAYAMEAQLRAWIDHAILARDHLGCARCAGLFWYLGLALAPWRGAAPRQLALYARGRSSGQQAPGGDAAGIRERRDTLRPGASFMQCVARSGLAPPWSIYGRR